MDVRLCTNCNGDNGGGNLAPAKLVIGTTNIVDSLANTVWPAGSVCTSCLACLRNLDFAEFVRRHDQRPRSMGLP